MLETSNRPQTNREPFHSLAHLLQIDSHNLFKFASQSPRRPCALPSALGSRTHDLHRIQSPPPSRHDQNKCKCKRERPGTHCTIGHHKSNRWGFFRILLNDLHAVFAQCVAHRVAHLLHSVPRIFISIWDSVFGPGSVNSKIYFRRRMAHGVHAVRERWREGSESGTDIVRSRCSVSSAECAFQYRMLTTPPTNHPHFAHFSK